MLVQLFPRIYRQLLTIHKKKNVVQIILFNVYE